MAGTAVVAGAVTAVVDLGPGRWRVLVDFRDGPFATAYVEVFRGELPPGVQEPAAGDVVKVYLPRLVSLFRTAGDKVVGGACSVGRTGA